MELGILSARIVDMWGTEADIINKARQSLTGRKVTQETLTEKDISLLKTLLFLEHGVPFEKVQFEIELSIPIFVARQMVKHRISSWSEMSKRYTGKNEPVYIPDNIATEVQGFQLMDDDAQEQMRNAYQIAQDHREILLAKMYVRIEDARAVGVLPPDTQDGRDPWRARARELARSLQPVGEFTEVSWTINFRSLANFLRLRLSEHAQHETRIIAWQIYDQMKERLPILTEFFDRQREAWENTQAQLMSE